LSARTTILVARPSPSTPEIAMTMQPFILLVTAVVAVLVLHARPCAAATLSPCKGTTIDPKVWKIDSTKNNHIDVALTTSPTYSATLQKADSGRNFGYDGQAVTAVPVTEINLVGHTYQSAWGNGYKHFRMGLTPDSSPSGSLASPYQLTCFVGGGLQRVLVVENNQDPKEVMIEAKAGSSPALALKVESGVVVAYLNGNAVHYFVTKTSKPVYAKVYFHEKGFDVTEVVVKNANCQKVVAASKFGVSTTTITTTTTTNTILDALHKRINELEGDDSTAKLSEVAKLQEKQLEAMGKKQEATSAKLATTAAELKVAQAQLATATANLDAASQNFAARLDALEARSGGTFAVDATTASKCGASGCYPEVSADKNVLTLRATGAGGTVKLDTKKCGVVDACELAQAVADNAKALEAL